ncbi:hypothetical protein JD844_014733 [Phrynosoma platyrhinos]|uniref:NADPH oxidase 5 n=1 Tax=Phrynosoma platyrhinos TaxID=52577 RepID=A0ABQ7SS59_PHRPL|nr:hypothetical protein JD844_014733 [Phrynosoma platyrhinos]
MPILFLSLLQSFFAERFFALFDSDESGTITLDELLEALKLLVHGSETDKLRFLFQVYDVDGKVPKSCLKESSISLPEKKLDDLTEALFESADSDRSGAITFEELRAELELFPEVMENLTISWLKPPTAPRKSRPPRYLSPAYWHNNGSKLLFLGIYVCVNILLFAFAALKHAGSGAWITLAKGCGQCLNLNCTFLVVSADATPVLDLATVHLGGRSPASGPERPSPPADRLGSGRSHHVRMSQTNGTHRFWEYLLTTRPKIGWVYGSASLTGLALQLLIGLILICSSTLFRELKSLMYPPASTQSFIIPKLPLLFFSQVFYWTHLSYIFIWALLIVHGPNFWKWFVVPGFLFLLEKILGTALSHSGGLSIMEINLLPSKVTHLVIQRPPFFHYKPGDYVYLNIPIIAKYEWHPFTISSAPEQTETLWLHIRSLGQWTNRLYEYFQHYDEFQDHLQAVSQQKRNSSRKWLKKYLFGSSALEQPVASGQDKMVEVLSYTPTCPPSCRTASEHEEVIAQSRNALVSCPQDMCPPRKSTFNANLSAEYHMRKQTSFSKLPSLSENLKNENMKLQKVDFVWINRDQKSFEWFVSLLTQLELSQANEDPTSK